MPSTVVPAWDGLVASGNSRPARATRKTLCLLECNVPTGIGSRSSRRGRRTVPATSGRLLTAGGAGALSLALSAVGLAAAVSVHVQHRLAARQNVHLTFPARHLPEGGYYYGVIVLKPYRKYTRTSPPPCSTSSNMLRTDYGYPQANGQVALALTPAKSSTPTLVPERLLRRRNLRGSPSASLRKHLPMRQ